MLTTIRKAIAKCVWAAVELVSLLFSLSGATVAFILGRMLLALMLGTVALGLFLRFSSHAHARNAKIETVPRWVYVISILLSIVEVGVMVEATDLPVRFNQPGFAIYHWVIVLFALFLACGLQFLVLKNLVLKH